MTEIGSIVKQYSKALKKGRFKKGSPEHEALLQEFRKELRPHMEPKFSHDALDKVYDFVSSWLPVYFNIPDGDFANIVTGTEKLEPYLGKEDEKIVLIVGPHNSHLNDAMLFAAMYGAGIGDIAIAGRSQMFKGKGDRLRDLGGFVISFFEDMPLSMIKASQAEIEDMLEHKVLAESNLGVVRPGEEKPHFGIPAMFAADGRSYFGKIDEKYPTSVGKNNQLIRINGNLKKLAKIQERHPEWDIKLASVVQTELTVPEQAILHRLPGLKNLNATAYQAIDYGTIIFNMFARKHADKFPFQHWQNIPKSDAYIDIKEPISLKEELASYDPSVSFDNNIRKTGQKIEAAIKQGYRVLPEKLFAYALMQFVDANDRKYVYRVGSLPRIVKNAKDQLLQKGVRVDGEVSVPDIVDKGMTFYKAWGSLHQELQQIKLSNPALFSYQANTIAHHFK